MKNLLASAAVLAADIDLKPKSGIGLTLGDLSVGGIIGGALKLILIVASVVFFFILVIGGIKWIMSGGDKANTEGARNQITAALVGLVIVFAAWAIASLIGQFFGGFSIFEFDIPSVTGT